MTAVDTPTWVRAFLALYFLVTVLLFFYGMHAYVLAWLYRRARAPRPAPPLPGLLPRVTVQLPIYNERYVAARLIDTVALLDYPRDRFEIQVLDDSTDDTVEHVAEVVAGWRERGVAVTQIRRADRIGFKAGALADGLATATGELVAVFDADFVPPPTFLRDTVPYFTDPEVGMVQTAWGHLNEDYSLATRAQAVALDGHFLIEQTVRNRCGAFMNFNGTAGVWRRACIEDAGGWSHDTLTEDLDLSYRAQLRGWRFVFLPDVVSPAELPSEVNGIKGQQFRWAKGSVQTAVKLLPRVFAAPLSPFERFEAFVHLTSHAVYPLLLLFALMALPALLTLDRHPEVRPWFAGAAFLVVASFGHPVLYLMAQRVRGRSGREAAANVLLVLAFGMGIAINNTRAFFSALFGGPGEFNRTPKFAIRDRRDTWRGKHYRQPVSPWGLAEAALALYAAATLAYAAIHGHWMVMPFIALYFGGAAYVGFLSAAQAVGGTGEQAAPVGRPERKPVAIHSP